MDEDCIFIHTTRQCTFYNLTPNNSHPLKLTHAAIILGDVARLESVLSALPSHLSFKAFCNLNAVNTFLTPLEFYSARTRGCDHPDGIHIESYGFHPLSSEKYLSLARMIRPDNFVSLTEEPREGGGRKSLKRALCKTEKFLDEAIAFKKQHELTFNMFVPFVGDFEDDLREEAMRMILARRNDLTGVVITGVYSRHHKTAFAQRKKVYAMLPYFAGLQMILSCDGSPAAILEGLFFGVTLFETAFAFHQAEKGRALLYDVGQWRKAVTHLTSNNYQLSREDLEEMFVAKEIKPSEHCVIDLNSAEHSKSSQPLLPDCACYACKSASRAYVHHLLKHNEMTGTVLLVIHNCWIYKELLEFINSDAFKGSKTHAIWTFFELFL